jgi:hypothetical protein
MDATTRHSYAAVGLTVKSGWAAAVLLLGPSRSPRVAESRRLELSDPAIPESRQPYHAGFGTARDGGPELARLLQSVREFGGRSADGLLRDYSTAGHRIAGVGIVVGSLIDPATIANAHIRIHALEGQLFPGVIEDAAARSALKCSIWRERDLYAAAPHVLRQPEQSIRAAVAALPRASAGSWRAEQKAASLAAWMVLESSGQETRSGRAKENSA